MKFYQALHHLQSTVPDVRTRVACPAIGEDMPGRDGDSYGCNYFKDYVSWVVVHLNDEHHWDRERIADWIDEVAEEHGLDLTLPTPDEIPPEPGEDWTEPELPGKPS